MFVADLDIVADNILGGDQYVKEVEIGAFRPILGTTVSETKRLPRPNVHIGQS
jgi:hypothetical protein